MAAAASFLAAPSPLARRPRPRHSLRHLARAAAARPSTGPLAPPPCRASGRQAADWPPRAPPRRARGGRSGTWRCATWRRAAGPLVVALTSAALILRDIGRASAFVIATPWKLQADELATVRLFKDNTPSVVYITNLVVHMADCLG
ncbi:protease Do-like 1, chloroplastic [Hordeum vulgare]|nr:protease Do-like 1, chloroplastic [Hordeum vulgare]